jgi:hypothetical protein
MNAAATREIQLARTLEYPQIELGHDPETFRDREEHAGLEHSLTFPKTNQEFVGGDALAAKVQDRLCEEHEIPIRQRRLHDGEVRCPRLFGFRDRGFVDLETVTPAVFGLVESPVSGDEQFLDCRPMLRKERDAAACAEADHPIGQWDHDLPDRVEQPLADVFGPLTGNRVQKSSEFVSAHAGDEFAGSQGADEPVCDYTQDGVTSSVTESIVHLFEVVEIEEQEGTGSPAPHGTSEPLLQRLEQRVAVSDTGQRVMTGEVCQALLDTLALADVFDCSLDDEGLTSR